LDKLISELSVFNQYSLISILGAAMKHSQSQYKNITKLDVYLAKIYADVLLGCGVAKKTTTYADLIHSARQIYEQDKYLANAIPVSTGRRLDVIRVYTLENGLPDITALVVSSLTDKPGSLGPQDPQILQDVLSFDWSDIIFDFDSLQLCVDVSMTQKKLSVKRPAALQQMSAYYKLNKEKLPTNISKHRDEIIGLITAGFPPEQAFYSFY
jgi:hypothetical protein